MKKLILMGLALFVFSSCNEKASNDPSAELAVVDGTKITYGDLTKKYPDLQKQLVKLEEQMYKFKKAYVEKMVEDKIVELEAKKAGVSIDSYLATNVSSKIAGVTDAEVDAFAKSRKLTKEQTNKLRDRIKMFLQKQKEQGVRTAFVGSLKKNHDVKISLKKPSKLKVNVKVYSEDPQMGPKSSKVSFIEFSDFQCPFCRRASMATRRILAEYKDRVHFVWKNFPLSFHNRARYASLAAMCANEEGKFFEYHDKVFDNNTALSDKDLIGYAKAIGIKDMKAFEKCYNSKKYNDKINKDISEAQSYGLSGTPSFFINGELHVGALPYEQLKSIVEEALNN